MPAGGTEPSTTTTVEPAPTTHTHSSGEGSGGTSGDSETTTTTTTILPPPDALVVNTHVELGATETSGSFTITNSAGTGVLAWSLDDIIYHEGENWIVEISPESGETTGTSKVLITVDRNGLAPGIYTAEIPVTSNAGSARVFVQLEAAPPEQPVPECASDADCTDAIFCNGEERCDNGTCAAGEQPCGADQHCDEKQEECFYSIRLSPDKVMNRLRKPLWFDRLHQWLILLYTGNLNINESETAVTIEGDNDTLTGIELDTANNCFQLYRYIFVPVYIYKNATLGSWAITILVQASAD